MPVRRAQRSRSIRPRGRHRPAVTVIEGLTPCHGRHPRSETRRLPQRANPRDDPQTDFLHHVVEVPRTSENAVHQALEPWPVPPQQRLNGLPAAFAGGFDQCQLVLCQITLHVVSPDIDAPAARFIHHSVEKFHVECAIQASSGHLTTNRDSPSADAAQTDSPRKR